MQYLLLYREDCFWFVGPFDSTRKAVRWATDPYNNSEDDPRWQVISLTDPTARPKVLSPTATPLKTRLEQKLGAWWGCEGVPFKRCITKARRRLV